MSYTAEQAAHLTSECGRFVGSLQTLMFDGLAQSSRVLPELAKTYLTHGVGRRLSVMRRSLAEIFDLFPPSRREPLSHELATDVQIRLHAFVINLSGVFDNWAWAFVHRHGLLGRLGGRRENVGLFNRSTGEPVDPGQLKTYSEILGQYHLSPEGKFLNGQFLDRGRTERRHVVTTEFVLIGKEANQVGESGEADPIPEAVQIFGRKLA